MPVAYAVGVVLVPVIASPCHTMEPRGPWMPWGMPKVSFHAPLTSDALAVACAPGDRVVAVAVTPLTASAAFSAASAAALALAAALVALAAAASAAMAICCISLTLGNTFPGSMMLTVPPRRTVVSMCRIAVMPTNTLMVSSPV